MNYTIVIQVVKFHKQQNNPWQIRDIKGIKPPELASHYFNNISSASHKAITTSIC